MKKLAILVLLTFVSLAPAQSRDPAAEYTRANPTFMKAFKGAVSRPSASTVRIMSNGTETALGVVVGPDGWILTKANDLHGVVTVSFRNGKIYDAEIIGIHQGHDLALLKIDARNLTPVEFKESKTADVGSWVACVGMNDEPVAIGVVSVATRNMSTKGFIDNSKQPYLGVSLEPDDEGGVKIQQVLPGTPAAKSGLKTNDIILALNSTPVKDPDSFVQAIARCKIGDTVVVKIRRGEEELEKRAILEKRPVGNARGELQNRMGSELSTRRSGYATILQHDSVVKPADCGGPIVDLEGRVVGINICRAGRVESWAVPSEVIQPILLELMSGKLSPKKSDAGTSRLTPEEKLAAAKAAIAKVEIDKSRIEKDVEQARQALKSAEAEVKAVRQKQSAEAGDRLLRLMQRRLVLMNDVAGWKWNHRVEVADERRETESLKRIAAQAKGMGIDQPIIDRFFQAQFAAARSLQNDAIAAWQKENVLAPTKGDLAQDLRPRVDQINDELLEALVQVQRFLSERELALADRLRQQAPRTLAGQGISDAVRQQALSGLFEGK